jgi:hypothetical protein
MTKQLAIKCPPRHVSNAGAILYRHNLGFRLLIPLSLHRVNLRGAPPSRYGIPVDTEIQLGTTWIGLRHRAKTLHGAIPPNWLIDLNSGPTEQEDDE